MPLRATAVLSRVVTVYVADERDDVIELRARRRAVIMRGPST